MSSSYFNRQSPFREGNVEGRTMVDQDQWTLLGWLNLPDCSRLQHLFSDENGGNVAGLGELRYGPLAVVSVQKHS
jgi:hypothetical protein